MNRVERSSRRRSRKPLFIFFIVLASGLLIGTAALTLGDSWLLGPGFIYPNSSLSNNVVVNGTLQVFGQHVCLENGSYCPASSGNGSAGPAGTNGTDGLNGTRWTLNTTFPSSPNINDSFLNTSTGVYWQWTGSAWVQKGNLTGPKGAQGSTGPQGDPGPQGATGDPGQNGTNGTGIASIYLLANGSLQINLTSGVNTTSGNLTGQKGDQGIQGIQGDQGATGATGQAGTNGSNGTGIIAIYLLSNGSLQINRTDLVNTTSGNLSGPAGPQGIQGDQGIQGIPGIGGTNGTNGTNGLNGTGIKNIYLLANGSLQINLTNGTNITTGNLTGQKGDTGAAGGGSVNGSDINVNRLNITTASDAMVTFNSSGFTWRTAMQLTGANFRILDPDGSVLADFNKNSDSATFLNLFASSSYNGAVAFTATGASGQTVDLAQFKNSSGSVLARVNGSGVVNASQGLCLGTDTCRTTWPSSSASTTTRNSTIANQVRTSNVPTPILNLSIPVAANEYSKFECRIPFMSNTSTSGLALSLNITASTNDYWYDITIPTSATAVVFGTAVNQNNRETVGTAVAANMANHTAYIRGSINTSGAGSIIPGYRSEINGNNVTIWKYADCEKTVIA